MRNVARAKDPSESRADPIGAWRQLPSKDSSSALCLRTGEDVSGPGAPKLGERAGRILAVCPHRGTHHLVPPPPEARSRTRHQLAVIGLVATCRLRCFSRLCPEGKGGSESEKMW